MDGQGDSVTLLKNIQTVMFCSNCGKEIPGNTRFCIHCGTSLLQETQKSTEQRVQEFAAHPVSANPQYSYKTAQILAMIPIPGLHRFYLGTSGSAIAQFISFPFFVGIIWWLIDNLRLLTNNYRDKEGRPLTGYSKTFALISLVIWVSLFSNAIVNGINTPGKTNESSINSVETASPEQKEEIQKSPTSDVALNYSTSEIPDNTDDTTKKSEPAIKPLPPVLPKQTIEEHRAIIADGAIFKYPETAQELKKAGYPKMLKKYGVNGIKKINSLLPMVAEKAAQNPTMDKIVNVDISNNRSTKNKLIFYVDAENSNRLYISETDLASDAPILSNQEKLKQLLPEHEKLCEELIKRQLTHPSTYDKSYFDSISQTQEYTNVIRIAFSAKNSFNLKINYIAVFRINADSEIVYQDIQEKQ